MTEIKDFEIYLKTTEKDGGEYTIDNEEHTMEQIHEMVVLLETAKQRLIENIMDNQKREDDKDGKNTKRKPKQNVAKTSRNRRTTKRTKK